MNVVPAPEKLLPKDYATDQEVRWCPGCGDYAILKAMQKTMAEIEADPAKTVFVSGIGCSSRFPYYMETYGFHTIHGRAPAIATGIRLTNPELDVWVIPGDGDGTSIGGNHLFHVLRRNVDLQVILFNNEIYGLTKGQASPTSRPGTKSPSTPDGSFDNPVNPSTFALGCGARFVARSIDTALKHLPVVFRRAHENVGASFVEVFQNCIVYNDDVFADFTDKKVAVDNQIFVEHGNPLIYGGEVKRGLRLRPGTVELESVVIGENDVTENDILIHDETNHTMATLLAAMPRPQFPVALGVLYCDPSESYDRVAQSQLDLTKKKKPDDSLNKLLRQGYTWTVQN
jgi:2-oxoglutarate ferredoxin oxidoreductase subunit beta